MIDQVVVDILEASAAIANDWGDIPDHIEITDVDPPNSPKRALVAAFQYLLKWDAGGSVEHSVRDAFEPMMRFQNGEDSVEIPPRPSRIDIWAKETWSEYAKAVKHPGLSSRLHDLSFCAGMAPAGHLEGAIDAYLAVADLDDWEHLVRSQSLVRALRLAWSAKLIEHSDRIRNRGLQYARQGIADVQGPGVVLPVVEALLEYGMSAQDALPLLLEARKIYIDPFVADQAIAMQLKYSPLDDKARLISERVDLWESAATSVAPMMRNIRLETALGIAEDAGLTERAQSLRSQLQETNIEDLGLQRTRSQFNLPGPVVDEFVGQFVNASSAVEALGVYFQQAPPTGDYEENVRSLEALAVEAPIAALIPRTVLGGDGLPRWRPVSPEQEFDSRLTEVETFRVQFIAPLLAMGLTAIGTTFGPVNRSELKLFLSQRPTAPDGFAATLAESLQLYWAENYPAAAYLAIPLVELEARSIVLKAKRGIYRQQRQQKPGQYPGLGALLSQLGELGLPASWVRYYASVFSSPAGMNLRNEMVHGFVGARIQAPICAVILHAVGSLSSLDVAADQSDATVEDSASSP